MLQYLITKKSIKLFIEDGEHVKQFFINKEDDKKVYREVYGILIEENSDLNKIERLIDILDKKKKIIEYFDNHLGENIIIENGVLYYKDYIIKNDLIKEIQELESNGVPTSPLKNFLAKLLKNPSYDSITELFLFLKHNKLPIKDNGNFIAYKKISDNHLDIYTNTIVNKPGVPIPRFNRDEVDHDRNNVCSYGYHVCGYDYLNHYGIEDSNIVVQVEVNPEDVVSVPIDYNNAKMRVTFYTVIEEIKNWRNYKIRDYYVPDDLDTYESWDNYQQLVEKPQLEFEDENENENENENEDDDILSVFYTSTGDNNQFHKIENKLYDYFEKFTPYTHIKYTYQNNTYKGFIVGLINAGESARKLRDIFLSSMLIKKCEEYTEGIKNSIKRDLSSINRLLVLVYEKNDEIQNKPFFLTPPASIKEG